MNNLNAQKLDNYLVLNQQAQSQYSIVFQGSTPVTNEDSCVITVKSRREVELFLLILEEEASVIMDEQARNLHPDVWEWLSGRTYSQVFEDLKWSYREENEVLDLIERIPLPKTLNNSFIQLRNEDPVPEPIDREYVHKIHQENVLVSKPFQCASMYYFNGFKASSEINIDHPSDHLEGIIIFETARQAGIASTLLAGWSTAGPIVILKTMTRYKKFVECSDPYLIHTIPVHKQKERGGIGYCVYNIIQYGASCAAGYFTAIGYHTKDIYGKSRNSKHSER